MDTFDNELDFIPEDDYAQAELELDQGQRWVQCEGAE